MTTKKTKTTKLSRKLHAAAEAIRRGDDFKQPHWTLTCHMGQKVEGRCSDGRTFSEPVRKTWAWAKGFMAAVEMAGGTAELIAAE